MNKQFGVYDLMTVFRCGKKFKAQIQTTVSPKSN